MKIASAATKRTKLNLLSSAAAAAMSCIFETNNKLRLSLWLRLRLRLRLQNKQQSNEQTQPQTQPQPQESAGTKRTALLIVDYYADLEIISFKG